MAKKKKVEEKKSSAEIFDGCEWVVQFDNDTPLLFSESEKGSLNQEVKIILQNTSESHITFNDSNTGKRFRIFARKKL